MGILYVYAIGPWVSYEELAILCGIIPVIMFVLVILIAPETPTYLLRAGKRKEAERSLVLLRGHEYDIAGELEELQQQLEEEQKRSSNFKDLISSRATVRASIAVMGLLSFLSFSGINVLIFYAESIFKSSSSSISPQVSSIIIGLLQVSVKPKYANGIKIILTLNREKNTGRCKGWKHCFVRWIGYCS